VNATADPRTAEAATSLRVVSTLLEQLHARDLPYCHWKSNEHVREGLLGLTDLDILVDRRRALELQGLLSGAGFKRFSALGAGVYPAVEDYLGFDEVTGKLVHLHLHYELVLGEKHLKGYRLPWEERLLASRTFDADHGVYTADPNLELLLLLLRSALKVRFRDRLKARLGKTYLGRDVQREYRWLEPRTDPQRVAQLAHDLLGRAARDALGPLLGGPPGLAALRAFRRAVGPTVALYRSYAPLGARWRRLVREGVWVASVLNKRYLNAAQPLRRVTPTGGRIIAFLGSDGAGKSTLLQGLSRWLSWKLDVYSVYHGSGDGRTSLLRLPLRLGLKLLKSRRRDAGDAAPPAELKTLHLARVLWALVLSCEKRTKLRSARRARNQGMIVLADRYPQDQVLGFNDGPLLGAWQTHPTWLRRALARWERQPYTWATQYPPDLVVKLRVSPEVAHQRKPEMPLSDFQRRVAAVESLNFATDVVVIDADRPADEVLYHVKRLVWELL
jgi:hypothetical protein